MPYARTSLVLLALLALGSSCGDKDTGGPSECAGPVKINEFLVNPASDDEGKEWVELYNTGSEAVDLSGWKIQWATKPDSTSESDDLPDGTTIQPGGYLLLGEADVEGADVVVEITLGSGSGGDGLYLLDCEDGVIDGVVYGGENTDGVFEDSSDTSVSAPELGAAEAGEEETLIRCPDGDDTNVSASDFCVATVSEEQDWRSPGASNQDACDAICVQIEPGACKGPDMKLNEFLVNPASDDEGKEWIELYNAGSSEVDIGGWTLQWMTSDDIKSSDPIPNTQVPPGGFVLIGGAEVAMADVVLDTSLGSGSDGDGLYLVDCEGALVDSVVYGGENGQEVPEDPADPDSFPQEGAPAVGEEESLMRCPDGDDTNVSADDWCLATSEPTDWRSPGDSNTDACEALCPACEHGASDVTLVLNEVMANPDGTDGDAEWFEIKNTGRATANLACWVLEIQTSDDTKTVFLPPLSVPAGGYVVYGNTDAAVSVDASVDITLGNGSSGDAIRLVDGDGGCEDALVYGSDNEDGVQDCSGVATSLAPAPGDGQALARCPDGADTNRSADDFQELEAGSESAGAANGCGK